MDALSLGAGICLAGHFASEARITAGLVCTDGLWHPPIGGAFRFALESFQHLGSTGVRIACGGAAVAGLLSAGGVAIRPLGVLLFVYSIALYSALTPLVTVDDQLATLLSFWIALAGGVHETRSPVRSPHALNVTPNEGYAFAGFSLLVLFFYVHVGLTYLPRTITSTLFVAASAALLVMPGQLATKLALLPGTPSLVLLYHSSGSWFPCFAFATTYVAFLWSAFSRKRRESSLAAATGNRLGSAAVLVGIVAAVLGLNATAASLGARSVESSTHALLSIFGLPPFAARLSAPSLRPRLNLLFAVDGNPPRAPRWEELEEPRSQALLLALGTPSLGERYRGARANLLQGLVRRYCRPMPQGGQLTGEVLLGAVDERAEPVAWFECGPGTEDARSVFLETS